MCYLKGTPPAANSERCETATHGGCDNARIKLSALLAIAHAKPLIMTAGRHGIGMWMRLANQSTSDEGRPPAVLDAYF